MFYGKLILNKDLKYIIYTNKQALILVILTYFRTKNLSCLKNQLCDAVLLCDLNDLNSLSEK